MNRREKRKLKKEINIFSDVVQIIKQYFPQLTKKLNELTDVRHKSYIEYQMSVITVTRLLGLFCGIKSMRETTEKLNTKETIKNISNFIRNRIRRTPTLWYNKWCIWKDRYKRVKKNTKIYDNKINKK